MSPYKIKVLPSVDVSKVKIQGLDDSKCVKVMSCSLEVALVTFGLSKHFSWEELGSTFHATLQVTVSVSYFIYT